MRHVVMLSGGLGSWMTAKRAKVKMQPGDDMTLLFADVKGVSTNPYAGEDADTYRFLHESAADVGHKVTTVMDGREIWQVYKDDRFLGNSRLANCSKFLKQKPCRDWLDANCDPTDTIVYVGIGAFEIDRLPDIESAYAHPFGKPCERPPACTLKEPCKPEKLCRRHWPCTATDACKRRLDPPWRVAAPLTEPPYLDGGDLQRLCVEAGMEVPRLYRAGFEHNNCAGFCVRAGQAQMENLHRVNPDLFRYHEEREQELRDHLDKDVAILRDRTGGTTTPLTLTAFRERLEDQPELFDPNDFGGGGCAGCFTGGAE